MSLSLLWKLTLPKSQIASAVPLSFFLKILPKHSIASTVPLEFWKLPLPKAQIASTVSLRFLEQNLFPNTKSQAPWPFGFFYPPPSLHPYTPIIASTVSLSLLWKLTLPKSQIASTVSLRVLEQNLFPNTKSQAPWPFVFFYPPPSLHPYTSIIASTVSLSLLWKLTLPKSQIASAVPLSFFFENPSQTLNRKHRAPRILETTSSQSPNRKHRVP